MIAAVAVVLGAGAAAWWVNGRHENDIHSAIVKFRSESRDRSAVQAQSLARAFSSIYEGIRTIARLPGVRAIDRYAHNFDANARGATQEIYNNLASNVPLSEVYIVPLDMHPDEPDPVTGKTQEPITTFDELIVGRTAGTSSAHDQQKEDQAGREAGDSSEPPEVEEVEIYEYRLMRRQLDWLAQHYPNEDAIKGLEYPAVCGPEVVTCDNTRFDPGHPNDKDRSGLVYSVPFFGQDGRLRGCISAVILTHRLRDMIPSGDFALRNLGEDYTVRSHAFGVASLYGDDISGGQATDELIYSEALRLPVLDGLGRWVLWCGRSNLDFELGPDARAAEASAYAGYIGIAAIAGTLLLTIRGAHRTLDQSRRRASELERLVAERTAELQEALSAADRACRAKSDFLANMSHEIRTPMTAVMGYADLLLDPALAPVERAAHVQTIRRQSEHLLGIINDILDISKIEAGAMCVEHISTDPIQTCEDVLSLMRVRASQKSLTLRAEYAWPVPGIIPSDPVRLRQILVNLVGNAVKFTASGSVILRLTFDAAARRIRFEVVDSGIGMNPDQLAQLFKPFTQADGTMTRRFGGTGLGLAISKRLANILGGDLNAVSEQGRGSTFTLELETGPIEPSVMRSSLDSRPAAAATEPAIPTAPASSVPLKVLLAEDSADNQRLIAFHLRRAGHTAEVVDNGKDAVERAAAAQASGSPYDVVLMDMQMPEMDGYTAASELRARGYARPIIALTAHAMSGDRERCIQSGCDDHLTKPIDPAKLVQACGYWASLGHQGAPSRTAA